MNVLRGLKSLRINNLFTQMKSTFVDQNVKPQIILFCPFRKDFSLYRVLMPHWRKTGSGLLFCSTNLPLTSNKWVRSTIKLCSVLSLSSALSINISNIKKFRIPKKSWEHWESNLGLLGEKQESYPLCFAPPPPRIRTFWQRIGPKLPLTLRPSYHRGR